MLRLAQRSKPSYSQFLQDLLSRELEDKRRRTIANRLKQCGLTDYWTLESFPWHIQKSLARQRKAIEELAELDFLERGESVVFVGKPGVGKSGLASAILLKASTLGGLPAPSRRKTCSRSSSTAKPIARPRDSSSGYRARTFCSSMSSAMSRRALRLRSTSFSASSTIAPVARAQSSPPTYYAVHRIISLMLSPFLCGEKGCWNRR
jgi:hypothetical protein